MSAMQKPIVFFLGPSGSGKTQLAGWVAEDLRFNHIEIDRWPEDGINLEELRKEWDAFLESGQAADLASAIRNRVEEARMDGAILSFPGRLVLPTPRIEAAKGQGIRSLILYGTGAECLKAFLQRERQAGRGLDANFWIHNNAQAY